MRHLRQGLLFSFVSSFADPAHASGGQNMPAHASGGQNLPRLAAALLTPCGPSSLWFAAASLQDTASELVKQSREAPLQRMQCEIAAV